MATQGDPDKSCITLQTGSASGWVVLCAISGIAVAPKSGTRLRQRTK